MLILNTTFYLQPDRAPQIHSGTADLLPAPGTGGLNPLTPSGISSSSLQALPEGTWGVAWAAAPPPGQPGTSSELIAIWGGLPSALPPLPSDRRSPEQFVVRDRIPSDSLFPSESAFKSAVAARQSALGAPVSCFEATGTRYADLNTAFSDASEGADTYDLFRESDGSKVGEAFVYRASATQTVQHWVLFNPERFDHIRVQRRAQGYATLAGFLSSLSSQKTSGVAWPHTVETVTHLLSCPW